MHYIKLCLPRPALLACFVICLVNPAIRGAAADFGTGSRTDAAAFNFTVTSDLHLRSKTYSQVLDAMVAHCGGQGAFQISVGDVCDKGNQSPQPMRDLIDARFGANARWFPVVGNHDAGKADTREAIEWRKTEFATGHGVRTPLKQLIVRAGPSGTTETTYSWDHGNAHFVVLNEYWDGNTAPGSDTATNGDIVPALRAWLEADLAANTKPFVFVFGHEPAFTQFRHLKDSLNAHPENCEAFWKILVRHRVQAFISGHIHYYYKEQHDGVWQISDGNAGNGGTPKYQAYLNVIVGPTRAEIKVWQNDAHDSTTWNLADTITVDAVDRAAPAKTTGAAGRP